MKDPKEQRLKELHDRFQSLNRKHDVREAFHRMLRSPRAWVVALLCGAILLVLFLGRMKH